MPCTCSRFLVAFHFLEDHMSFKLRAIPALFAERSLKLVMKKILLKASHKPVFCNGRASKKIAYPATSTRWYTICCCATRFFNVCMWLLSFSGYTKAGFEDALRIH